MRNSQSKDDRPRDFVSHSRGAAADKDDCGEGGTRVSSSRVAGVRLSFPSLHRHPKGSRGAVEVCC